MLAKLLRSFTSTLLMGATLLNSCATYMTTRPDTILAVKQTKLQELIPKEINYSNLSWQEAIAIVTTPAQAQDYLDRHFEYESQPGYFIPGFVMVGKQQGESFKYNHTIRKGSCFDYATAAAALLSDDGYPALILRTKYNRDGHAVFLYRHDTGFGALGSTPLAPVFGSVEDLVKGLEKRYLVSGTDKPLRTEQYSLVNLDDNYENQEWVHTDENLHLKMPRRGFVKVK